MRVDLHTHSILSDGELVPAELVRRAKVLKHDAIAITDHVDMTNVDRVVTEIVKAAELSDADIMVIPGVEVTHVPPAKMGKVIARAKELGAVWIVVHGETVAEPVMSGTNRTAVRNPDVNVLAHPGFITDDDARTAADNGVILEVTGRSWHNVTNGHVAAVARRVDAKIVINSDAHGPGDLMTEERAMAVAMGSGMTREEAIRAVNTLPADILKRFA
jgi:histidinol phosphatase-like PHP family hydrolase